MLSFVGVGIGVGGAGVTVTVMYTYTISFSGVGVGTVVLTVAGVGIAGDDGPRFRHPDSTTRKVQSIAIMLMNEVVRIV